MKCMIFVREGIISSIRAVKLLPPVVPPDYGLWRARCHVPWLRSASPCLKARATASPSSKGVHTKGTLINSIKTKIVSVPFEFTRCFAAMAVLSMLCSPGSARADHAGTPPNAPNVVSRPCIFSTRKHRRDAHATFLQGFGFLPRCRSLYYNRLKSSCRKIATPVLIVA